MLPRKDAVKLIKSQMNNATDAYDKKNGHWHYGKTDLRELLDAIYGGPPASKDEQI